MAELFTLTCDKLQDAAFVGFRGKEQISRPYEFDLFFTVPVGTAVRDAVGQRAALKVQRSEDAEPILFHGVIAAVSLVHQNTNKKRTDQDRALYRALLVPRLWLLQQFWRSFVFVEKNVKEFLTETLEAGGLLSGEFRFDIDEGSYPKEEFVAHYRESYLDFFHRWLEREGLYYFFEQKDGAGNEVLVIADDKGHSEGFPGGGKVRYFPIMGDDAASPEGLHELEADMRWLPKTVTIADYNYANPTSSVKGDSSVTEKGVGTIRDYGFRVFVEGEAKRLAKVKAQAIGCRETTLRASGTSLGPRAGYKLSIDERPEDLEEEWLAIEVEHTGVLRGLSPETARLTRLPAGRTYGVKILAIPASVQYRAPQATPWPRIYGFENGVIMGEADSPYAQLDADGRYLVRFEFDTSDLPDGKVSTRVRMLQPHGGDKEGFHFPLRKTTEVMIAFLGGDCNRPFIAGVVPNAHKPSVVGKRNNTQNIIRTGSNNQIVMEDEQGKEFMFLHSPNNHTGIYMGHPAGTTARLYTGEGDQPVAEAFVTPGSAHDGTTATRDVPVSLFPQTNGNAGLFVGGQYWVNVIGEMNVFVQENANIGYMGSQYLDIFGNSVEWYQSQRRTYIAKGRTSVVTAGGESHDVAPFLYQTVRGSGYSHVNGGDWGHSVSGKNTDTYGNWDTDCEGTWDAKFGGGSVTMKASSGGQLKIKATDIEFDAATITIKGKGKISATAPSWFKDSLGIDNTKFVGKNSAGIEKIDLTAVKGEVTGASRTAVGSKMELFVSSRGVGISKNDTYAQKDTKTITDTKMGALRAFTQGFFKL